MAAKTAAIDIKQNCVTVTLSIQYRLAEWYKNVVDRREIK